MIGNYKFVLIYVEIFLSLYKKDIIHIIELHKETKYTIKSYIKLRSKAKVIFFCPYKNN